MLERRLIGRFAEVLGEHTEPVLMPVFNTEYYVCGCGYTLVHERAYGDVVRFAYEEHVAEELLEVVMHLLPEVDSEE